MDILLKTALLGMQKMPLDTTALPNTVREALAKYPKSEQTAEQQFLRALLLRRAYIEAGQLPAPTDALTLVAAAETLPICDLKSSELLAKIFAYEVVNPILFRLFLQKIAAKKQLIPPTQLVSVLKTCATLRKTNPDIWTLAEPVLGVRGAWLRDFNPEWQAATVQDFEHIWQFGKTQERLEAFRQLRKNDRALSFQYFQSAWQTANSREKSIFLLVLRDHFSVEEVPFLEQIWQSLVETGGAPKATIQELKRLCVQLLLSVETSTLTQTVVSQLAKYVKIERKALGLMQKTIFVIPPSPDDWLNANVMIQQFGFEPMSTNSAYTDTEYWVLQLAEILYPSAWEKILAQDWKNISDTLSTVACLKKKQESLPLFVAVGAALAQHPYRAGVLTYIKKTELTDENAPMLRALTFAELEQYALTSVPLHRPNMARTQLLTQSLGTWSPKLSLAVIQAMNDWEHYDPKNAEFTQAACAHFDLSILPDLQTWTENTDLNDWRVKMSQQQILMPTIRTLLLRKYIEAL